VLVVNAACPVVTNAPIDAMYTAPPEVVATLLLNVTCDRKSIVGTLTPVPTLTAPPMAALLCQLCQGA
jgi:hypothetical protein